jgi:hypothetical protein
VSVRQGARRIGAAGACVVLMACAHPSNQIRQNDPAYGHRWHANLVTPSPLAGVAQVSGEVNWGPGSGDASVVHIRLANAVPGGVHPWAIHQGQCGNDQGVVTSPDRYPPLSVGHDGEGTQAATLPVALPLEGQYFVSVLASKDNPGTIYACGNLSPPVG